MSNYKNLDILKNSKSVCLISHIEPDADAIASMVVFRDFLIKHFNIKTVDIYAAGGETSDYLAPILGNIKINKQPKSYHTAIAMDCPNPERLGLYKQLFDKAKTKVVIDHHATNVKFGDINVVENVSSTCEIIYLILAKYKFDISKENQGKLYAGIITDTYNFTVGNITPNTFKICGAFAKNIDISNIYNHFLNKNTLKTMQLLSLAIQNIVTFNHGNILLSHISHEESEKFRAQPEDFTGIINKLATIHPAKLVCFIKPQDESYYVSMRASKGYDISAIAKKNNGGGHTGAAAFLSNKGLRDIEENIVKEFIDIINNSNEKPTKLF